MTRNLIFIFIFFLFGFSSAQENLECFQCTLCTGVDCETALNYAVNYTNVLNGINSIKDWKMVPECFNNISGPNSASNNTEICKGKSQMCGSYVFGIDGKKMKKEKGANFPIIAGGWHAEIRYSGCLNFEKSSSNPNKNECPKVKAETETHEEEKEHDIKIEIDGMMKNCNICKGNKCNQVSESSDSSSSTTKKPNHLQSNNANANREQAIIYYAILGILLMNFVK